ncbi:hypothetical protein OG394_29080 [Kribbella sp. NBC_01245]|uniref:hypothetical protein n=1 Tax=Kribbella sp. NBC_01245 TaxID=2903578 RepID=UPI002E280FD0|nr:hypothetical protein [Kribbella sp. NBC_01245]
MAATITLAARAARGPALLPAVLAARTGYLHEPIVAGHEPQPFVIGYIDAACLPRGKAAIARTRLQLTEFADAEHLALGHIYVDYPGLGGSSFRVLLIAADRYNPQHILVPSLAHVETPADVRHGTQTRQELIQRHTLAKVRPLSGKRPRTARSA